MSTFEQSIEKRDDTIQYILFACEPYETVAFKIPNQPIDRSPERFFTHWDDNTNMFYLQFYFQVDQKTKEKMERLKAAAEGGDANMEEEDEEAAYEIEEGAATP